MTRFARGLAVAVVLLGLAELGARVVGVPGDEVPAEGRDILLDGNPWLLWELVPGTHAERGVTVHVNAGGFRGPEPGPKRGERWMTVGDSSVYGFGVEDDETFAARLAAARGVEVLNLGVPGYSTFQVLNQLRMRGLGYAPDVLVVGTLWSDNNFDSFVDRELLASYAGWSGTERVRTALGHVALYRALDWTLRVRPQADHAHKVGWTVGDEDAKIGLRRVAIADYAANLDALCQLVPRAVFVLLANREDLVPISDSPSWAPYRDVLRDAAARCGAPVLDVPALFRASGEGPDALFLDQMHPTPTGHRLIGEALARLTPGTVHPAAPGRAWTDRYDQRPVVPPVVHGELRVPQFRGGRILLDFEADGRVVASVAVPGPGPVDLTLPTPATALRATLDTAQDGPSAGDLEGVLTPLPAGSWDFSGVAFGAPG